MSTNRPRPTHIRDGACLVGAGLAGWGVAPIAGHPALAIPALAVGGIGGVSTMVAGSRHAHRQDLVDRFINNVAPLTGSKKRPYAKNWTALGWPGKPKRLVIPFGIGVLKFKDGVNGEIGDRRWAGEIAKLAGKVFEADYKIGTLNTRRGRLVLEQHEPTKEEEAATNPKVERAKRVIADLLGSTAQFTNVVVDPETGEVKRLELKHEVGSKLVASGYRARIDRTVNGLLPGRWRSRWDMEADTVVFEVRPTLPDSLWIPPLEITVDDPMENYRQVEIAYGVDEDGERICWRPAIVPQWLITGTTGSGKTSTAHGIVAQATQYGWPVWVVDGKGIEFLGFRDWPNVQLVATNIRQQVAVIHRAWALMEHRYTLVEEGRARPNDFEPLILFIDEFTDLKQNLLAWYREIKVKGDPTEPRTLAEIGSIARKGRTARIHMVLAMQRPDAKILDGENRENFGMRTSMGRLSPEGAGMMWNNQAIGVSIPIGKTGRAIGVNSLGAPVEMQAYRVPDPKESVPGTIDGDLIEKLRPKEARHPRLVIVPPQSEYNLDSDDPVLVEPTFTDYCTAEWATAADRPDLDPLVNVAADASGGRTLASTMAFLGLADDAPATPSASRDEPADVVAPTEPPAAGFGADGFGDFVTTRAAGLQIGDLVCVDQDTDQWAVVDEEPVEDFDDPDCVVISWRDDQDDSGVLVMPSDSRIQIRRPLEESYA